LHWDDLESEAGISDVDMVAADRNTARQAFRVNTADEPG
jgi:hypothetical protein